ncbi:MAG: hypothetical protein LUC32_00025 [Clostridiales bacterium]|nr:hypothetical protein [Clostridiales bacterium]
MEGSWLASGFYCLSWVILAGSFFFWKKTEKKSYTVTWFVLTVLLITCYQTFCAAILNVVGVPINIVSIGLADLIPAVFFVYHIVRDGKIQKYCFEIADIIFLALVVVFLLLLCKVHYSGSDLWINFATIDPAAHLNAAIDVIKDQCVNNMFYSALFNGLFLETFLPARGMNYVYQSFVLSNILNCGLAGVMFFGVIRRYMGTRFEKAAGIVIAVLYVAAYPLSNALYGFVYLGMGVTLALLLIELTRIFLADEINPVLSVVLLCLGCLALFECYMLFVPVVFFAIISCVFVKQWRKKALISWKTIILCLGIFLVPCVIEIAYSYFGIFTDGLTVSGQIASEGAIYRSLYVNFLPYLPFALYELISDIREKKNRMVSFLFVYTMLFMALLFAGGMMGKVSSYYFYKLPYLFWGPLLIMGFLGVLRVAEKAKGIVVCGFSVWLCVFLAGMTGAEYSVSNTYPLFDTNPALSETVNDIYISNRTYVTQGGYPYYKVMMYHWAYENLLTQGEDLLAFDVFWEAPLLYQAFTSQSLDGCDYASEDHISYYEMLRTCDAEYIVVLTGADSRIYWDNQEYWDSLEKVYENDEGFVAKLDLELLDQYQ